MSGNRWPKGRKIPGSGRKKGTQNKLDLRGKAKLLEEAASSGRTPLEFLLWVMRDKRRPVDIRLIAARAAAPYCHRALKAIEHTGEGGGPVRMQIEWMEPSG